MHDFGLVVVDPVRAFTDPGGVIGQVHPADQFRMIRATVDRVALFAPAHAGPKVWVTSHHTPGSSAVATSTTRSPSFAPIRRAPTARGTRSWSRRQTPSW